MGVVEDLPADAPQPRLCHLVKRTDFSGYGFNLHAEKAKPGQFIGAIDPDSPADHAGLKEGDRIVEVNGVNINQENHKQVVERIKSIDNETRLLVVSKAAEDVYKRFGVVVKGTLPTVQHTSSLDTAKKHKVSSSTRNDDDVMDFKEQTASSAPPPIPSSPLPDDDDGDSADRNSVGTPSNDQGENPVSTVKTGNQQGEEKTEEVQLSKNEIVVEVTIESSEEEGSETKSLPPDGQDEGGQTNTAFVADQQEGDEGDRRVSTDGSVQSGSTASFKYSGNPEPTRVNSPDLCCIPTSSCTTEAYAKDVKETPEVDVKPDEMIEINATEPVVLDRRDVNEEKLIGNECEEKEDKVIDEVKTDSHEANQSKDEEEVPITSEPVMVGPCSPPGLKTDALGNLVKTVESEEKVEENPSVDKSGKHAANGPLEIKLDETQPSIPPLLRSGSPISSEKSTTASESGSVSPGRSFSPNSIEIERKDQLRDLRKSYHAGDNVSQTSAVVAEKNRFQSWRGHTLQELRVYFYDSGKEKNLQVHKDKPASAESTRRVTSGDWGGLNLNMTAQEMRELIGSKKKRDPRREEKLDFHKKYEIIQTL